MTQLVRPFDLLRPRVDALVRAARRLDEGHGESVHQTRVASRRLREVLPVLGLPRDAVEEFSRRLKKATKHLGAARELDVLMLTIQELGRDARYSSTALDLLGASVQRSRVAAHERLAAKLSFSKIQRLARNLRRAATQSESTTELRRDRRSLRSGQAWVWAVDARVTRRAAGVGSVMESVGTVYAPERLHEVRIAVKKLRYAVELSLEARSRRRSADLKALKATQDLLGRLHDLEILMGRAQHEQVSLSPPSLTAWRELDSLISALEADCRALHARYIDDRARLISIVERLRERTDPTSLVSRRAVS